MKKLDYDKLIKESDRHKISVYLLVKRKIRYRKAKDEHKCKFCMHLRFVDYKPATECFRKKQCVVIGESMDMHSDIGDNNTCDYFEKISR